MPQPIERGISAFRRFGFHPLAIGESGVHQLRSRRRLHQLRTDYPSVVASCPPGASLVAPEVDVPPIGALPSELRGAAAELCDEAKQVLDHRVDLLGSGWTDLGPEIDWHRDFKSGYRWAPVFYQDVEITRLDDASDAKVPWELSRGHQLLTLARAARLSGDERFAAELESQLGSWLSANPAGYGINWVTPMELAFRAINWIWAIGTVESVRPLSPHLRSEVVRALQVHGRHIALHLEGSPLLKGNHYLADVLGLFVLSCVVEGDPDTARWARLSRRALEREIYSQVLDDGVGFEASLPYHGLALEMFLLAWHLGQARGRPLSAAYRQRLAQMLEVSRSVRHPGGRSPVFGDQDSGRLLAGSFRRPPTHDHLLDLGAAALEAPRWRDAAPDPEVAWTLGLARWTSLAERAVDERPATTAFPAGGLYVLQGAGLHMVVRWGDVGQNGNGGHAHNDLSSYELSVRGTPIVIDPGTYVYTADPGARNELRSAAAHNVASVDGLDMNPVEPGELFRLPDRARFNVQEWRESADQVVLEGSHDGFARPGAPVLCHRRVTLDRSRGAIEVADEADGGGTHLIESRLHLDPAAAATVTQPGVVTVRADSQELRLEFTGAQELTIEPGWVSPSYGVRVRAPVVRAAAQSQLPAGISYRIVPT